MLTNAMSRICRLVGGFGHAVANKGYYNRGIDVLLVQHVDNTVSTWSRTKDSLQFKFISHYSLLASNVISLAPRFSPSQESVSVAQRDFIFMAALPGLRIGVPSGHINLSKKPWYPSSIFLTGMTTDGSICKWEIDGSAGAPSLVSIKQLSSRNCSSMSSFPGVLKVGEGNYCSSVVAVGTRTGHVEIYTTTKGRGTSLGMEQTKCFEVSKIPILGLTWTGSSRFIVAYTSSDTREVDADRPVVKYKNVVYRINVKTGHCLKVRDQVEMGKIEGIRASPTGAYILLRCSGVASEIWAVAAKGGPCRLRQIDLQFSSVEWLPKGFGRPVYEVKEQFESSKDVGFVDWTDGDGDVEVNELPEEMLNFSLHDGRLGILVVKGRKIQDARPKASNWAPLVTGEFKVCCAAASGHYIFLGGDDGTLARWNTQTGDTIALETGSSSLRQIDLSKCSDQGKNTIF